MNNLNRRKLMMASVVTKCLPMAYFRLNKTKSIKERKYVPTFLPNWITTKEHDTRYASDYSMGINNPEVVFYFLLKDDGSLCQTWIGAIGDISPSKICSYDARLAMFKYFEKVLSKDDLRLSCIRQNIYDKEHSWV